MTYEEISRKESVEELKEEEKRFLEYMGEHPLPENATEKQIAERELEAERFANSLDPC